MGARDIWIEPLGHAAERKAVAVRALEEGFSTIVLDAPDEVIAGLGRVRTLLCRGDALLDGERRIGSVVTIDKPADIDPVHNLRGQDLTVLLRCRDWKVIPLENLVANFQGTPTRVVAEVTSAAEALAVLGTLEVGCDGVVLRTGDSAEVTGLARRLEESLIADIELVAAEVVSVRAVGLGDRVCVDTCSLLREGQGMLVGSQSSLLALVQAETLESGYVASRPFRVNAGPIHSYTLVPGGRTRYLSELSAGEEVLVVDREGHGQTAVVGRVKIERRPLLLIRFHGPCGDGSLIAQNAETVRLVGHQENRSVAALQPGNPILVHPAGRARHFGMAIEESLREV